MVKRREKIRARSRKKNETSLPPTLTKEDLLTGNLQLAEGVMSSTESGCGDSRLSEAKAYWLLGEWAKLAQLDVIVFRNHPERDRIALLVASAHLQLGDPDKARKLVLMAQDWGCPKCVVAQILVAGVHNTLGRMAALAEDETRIAYHFDAAVQAIGTRRTALESHARSVREMARMGLLPQAFIKLDDLVDNTLSSTVRIKHTAAHAKVISMEIDWLRDKVLQLNKEKSLTGLKLRQKIIAARQESVKDTEREKQYHGLFDLDRKIEAYLDYDNGFFVELGANDGIKQSNTLFFERERGWRGILIEPIVHNFIKCKKNRSSENSLVSAACVSFDYDKPYVNLTYSNLMTTPSGLESDIDNPAEHAKSGEVFMDGDEVVEVLAPARTLSSIFDDEHAPTLMDFMSLDVEGAEIEVLKGIDHSKYRFKYLLIECRDIEKLVTYLAGTDYSLADKLSQHDYLFVGGEA